MKALPIRHQEVSHMLKIGLSLAAAGMVIFEPGTASSQSSLPPQSFELKVIDGDTLRIQGSKQIIRLFGVDACEKKQMAVRHDGRSINCSDPAVSALQHWTEGKTARCEIRGYDRYKRALAICGTQDVPDFAAELIRQGLAIAYRYRSRAVWPAYQPIEDQAKQQRRGIWAYRFEQPWIYRKQEMD